ncbi:MAG: hypothetical protein NC418_04785 [Muribaculaceae bacterium]|nr:hypothetical protein [Muribaculaceae bacterium]
MAQLVLYRCKNCGYEVASEPYGHFATMQGEFYNFRCYSCREIVVFSALELAKANKDILKCPDCGGQELACWSPLNGKCPKCDGELEQEQGYAMMVD